MAELLLGIYVGTYSSKGCSLVLTERSSERTYRAHDEVPKPSWAEQERLAEGMLRTFAALETKPKWAL